MQAPRKTHLVKTLSFILLFHQQSFTILGIQCFLLCHLQGLFFSFFFLFIFERHFVLCFFFFPLLGTGPTTYFDYLLQLFHQQIYIYIYIYCFLFFLGVTFLGSSENWLIISFLFNYFCPSNFFFMGLFLCVCVSERQYLLIFCSLFTKLMNTRHLLC